MFGTADNTPSPLKEERAGVRGENFHPRRIMFNHGADNPFLPGNPGTNFTRSRREKTGKA